MSRPAPQDDIPVRRIDRILTFMSLGLIVVSILCFLAVIIATGAGMSFENFEGVWLLVRFFPFLALPTAFILIIVLLVMTFVRRGRANRGA